jgi:hypothetical protein
MIRNLKVLGVALAAVFAMSAMMASAASAASFTVEKTPATITGNQKTTHTLEVTGQSITCKVVAFEGTTSSLAPTSVKMAATYDECSTGGGISATITGFAVDDSEIGQAGKCWYRLDAAGSAGLECNNAEVTIDAATCQVHLPAQNFGVGAVTYSTEQVAASGKHDLTVNFAVTGVTATHTDGFLCPFGSSGHNGEGKFHGTSTATAETEITNEPLHLTHHP